MVQLALVQVGSSSMDMTEFVAKHGDPSRPNYAAQHPNGGHSAGTKRMASAGFLAPSPNTPPSDVGITVAEDKKVFSLAENAKRTGNLASESSPAVSGDGRENYKKINRMAAQAHQNVADALEPKLYEMVDGEKVVRTGLASDTKKNLVTAIDWYNNKAMSFMDASRTLSATSGSVPEGSTPYRRF